jgi:hypothetical protein
MLRMFKFDPVKFVFAWPKKSNQKKGHPTIWSLRDCSALLAFIGAKINSLRSNKFLLDPMKAAMLGCIEGTKVKTQNPKPKTQNPKPKTQTVTCRVGIAHRVR